jgi:hypothetical protein
MKDPIALLPCANHNFMKNVMIVLLMKLPAQCILY